MGVGVQLVVLMTGAPVMLAYALVRTATALGNVLVYFSLAQSKQNRSFVANPCAHLARVDVNQHRAWDGTFC